MEERIVPTTQELVTTVEKELKDGAVSVIAKAQAIIVRDQESYDLACGILLNEIKPLTKRWLSYWTPLKDSAYQTYKGIMGKLQEGTDPLERAERHLKGQIAAFETEQQRIREAAQIAAQKAAEEAAEIEKAKAAEFAEMAGAAPEEVEAIASAPVVVVAAPVEASYEKVSGVSIREIWKCKVNDIKALCRGIAKGTIPTNYVIPNQSALDARAKADKSTLRLDGCVAYPEKVVAGRQR